MESLEVRENPAPVIQILGAPANSPEGSTITLGSQITDPEGGGPYTYAWSVTKNGAAFTTGTPTNGSSFTFTPDDNGTYVANLTVTTPDGQTATANTGSAAPIDVLIIYDALGTGTTALRDSLVAAGFNVALSSGAETVYNGTNPSLASYEAVIHLNGTTYATDMPTTGQVALRDYVQAGGAYIGGEYNSYEYYYGRLQQMRDLIPFEHLGYQSGAFTVSDVAAQAAHPVLANVPSSISFTGYYNSGPARSFATQPVTVLMRDQSGSAAVAVREFGAGRVVGFHHDANYSGALANADFRQLYVDGVRWAARPPSGGATITVTNVAPSATLTDNDPVNEGGTPVTVTFSNPSDPSPVDTQQGFRYSFATSTAGLATSYAAAGIATSAQFTFADSGTYTVFGRVFDKDGFRDYQTAVTVTNVAPTAVLSDNDPVTVGAPVTLTFTGATDPSPFDRAAGLRYSFATSPAGLAASYAAAGTSASGQLSYTSAGTFTAHGRIFDVDGGFRDYTTTVTVTAPLQATITGAPATSAEGAVITLGSTITDPLGQAPYSYAWSVTRNGVAYPTGTPTTGSAFTFTPTDNGTYVVGLTVTSADGRTSSGTTAAPTADVLILADTSPVNTYTQALRNVLVAAGFSVTIAPSLEYVFNGTNPALTPYEAVIHLDGVTWPNTMSTAGQQALNSYVQNGGAYLGSEWLSYEASSHPFMRDLILFDYGGESSGTTTYTDVAAQAGHPVLANVPPSFQFQSGRGLTTAHTFPTNPVTVLMRDQTGKDAVAVRDFGSGRVVGFSHTGNYQGYATLGDPNVQKLYIDGVKWAARLGVPGSAAATVTVANVAPAATLTANGPVAELTPVTLTFSNVTDPSADDTAAGFRYSFSASPNGLAASYAAAGASPTAQIAPSDDGNVTFYTRVFDKDGGFRDYPVVVAVTNAAPTATITNNGPVDEGSPVTVSLTNTVDSVGDLSNLRYSFATTAAGLAASYAAASTAGSRQFTFAAGGSYTVFGRVFDNEGASTDYQTTVTVQKLASISGTMFEDFDADGVRDANEPAHAGVTVYLDLNRNGIRDGGGGTGGEPSAVTDAQGNYTFTRLQPDTYVIREQLPAGFRQTFPGAGIADPGPGVFFGAAYNAQGQLNLTEIDAVSGRVTRIGAPMATRMHGMVMTNDGSLYGVNWPDSSFYRVNRTTGQTTLVGPAGFPLVGGLAYDPATDTIYGLGVTVPGPTPAQNTISLLVFDRATGAAAPLGAGITGMSGTSGLAFDAGDRRVLALDNDDRQVYAFDVATGAAALLSVLPAGTTGWGLAFDGQYAVVGRNASNSTLLGYYDPDTGALVRSLTMSEPATVEALEFVQNEPFTRRVAVSAGETVNGIDFGNKRANRAPVANAGGPYTVTEGQGPTLNASGSSDIEGGALSYAWDLDNDGQFDDATGVAPVLTWEQLVAFGIADDGAYTIRVRVTDTDPDGALSSVAGTTVTVRNAAPTVDFSLSATTVSEGSTLTVSGTVTDPGPLDTHTVAIAWGDGTTSIAAVNPDRTFTATHAYRDDDPTGTPSDVYQIGVAVRDDNGGSGGIGAQELISNGGFENGLTGWTVSGQANALATWTLNTGTFDPPGPSETTAPISGTADAVASQNGPSQAAISASIVVPSGLTSAVLSWSDRIRNYAGAFSDVPPVQEWRVRVRGASGASGAPLATVFSTNPGDPLQQLGPNNRSVDLTALLQGLVGQTVFLSFETDSNQFFLNVNLDDVSLVVVTGPGTPVAVTNVAPTAPALTVSPATEDGTVTLTGTFTDAGADDTHTVTVDWGDGTQVVLGGGATVPVSQAVEYNGHRYYVVRQQGLSWFEAQEQAHRLGGNLVTINDAAENTFVSELLRSNFGYYALAWIGLNDERSEGQFGWVSGESPAYTNWFVQDGEPNDYPLAVTEDFAITNYAYGFGPGFWNDLSGTRDSAIYWGAYAVVEVNPTRTFTLSHRYADDNAADAYTIGVAVTDDDTGAASATATAAVTNSAPADVTVTADAVTVNEDGSVTLTGSFTDRGTLDSHAVTIDWRDGTTSQVAVPAFPGTPSAGVDLAASGQFGGHTYHFISTPLSWAAAEAEARRMGGHLVAINSTAENVFLLEYIRRSALTGDVPTWIGLSDGGTERPFQWSSGAALDYAAWANGQPVNPAGPTGIAFNFNNAEIGARWGAIDANVPLFAVIEVDGKRTFSATHRFLDDNPTGTPSDVYSIGVTVTDDDGDSASASTAPVTVNNVAPVIGSLTGPVAAAPTTVTPGGAAVTFTGVRGQPLAFSTAFSDVGTLDTHQVQWDFGDGTVSAWLPASGYTAQAPAHAYAAVGTYAVTVTVRDDDGEAVSFAQQVAIKTVELQVDPTDPTKTALVVGGTTGNDQLQLSGSTTVVVNLNGAYLGQFTRTGRIAAYTQGGNDQVQVSGNFEDVLVGAGAGTDTVQLSGTFRDVFLGGDSGNDTLQVSGNFRDAVVLAGDGNDAVQISGSFMRATVSGGTGNDVMRASGNGRSILVGGDGNDELFGSSGRSLLIGGTGADRIVGGSDGDVLIAGSTAYDDDLDALAALHGVWIDTTKSYAQRVAALQSPGTLPDGIRLDPTTVFHDAAVDVLTGGAGQDWFLFDPTRDDATDDGSNELLGFAANP